MIGIVNTNPCVDTTLHFDTLPGEGIHTACRVEWLPGGKGCNVARLLRELQTPFRMFQPIGGETGQMVQRLLAERGIEAQCVEIPGPTRTITTLVGADWRQLAVKEPGQQLTDQQAAAVYDAFLPFLDGITCLGICGAASCPALARQIPRMIAAAKGRNIPVLLDASGESLSLGLLAAPDYAKPNAAELEAISGLPVETPEQAQTALRWLLETGVSHPLLTLGADGALTVDEHGDPLWIIPPQVETVNPVGCGDSFVGALLYALHHRQSWRDCLRFASAAGAANAAVWEPAGITHDQIETLLPQVRFS